jgi:hypothetical protein
MTTLIDIPALFSALKHRLAKAELARAQATVVGESGIQIRVEGDRCLTSIGIWPNGCCDVDFLYTESEQGEFKHYEFKSAAEAIDPVMKEVRAAIDRS